MRLRVRFPRVGPHTYYLPETSPYGCGGQAYRPHGTKGERERQRDIGYAEVLSYRYTCPQCGRTFRVYPQGASKGAQQSERPPSMMMLLYVLGLSFGAVEDFGNALGCGVGKTTVYNHVRAAEQVARRKQDASVKRGGKRAVVGADGTFVKVKGESVGAAGWLR